MTTPVPNELTTNHHAANVRVVLDEASPRAVQVHVENQWCSETDLLEIAAFLLLHAAQLRRKNA